LTHQIGAIPYHREHGTDAQGAGGRAIVAAMSYCLGMGFYPAVVDFGMRGRALVDPEQQPELYVDISHKTPTALAALDRGDEAEEIYLDLRGRYANPAVHLIAYYGLAMLYTRFHREEQKDHRLAQAHANTAIALASQLPDPKERAFQTVFYQNGRALVEMHLGNLETSLRLVSEGLDRLERELGPDRHKLHRSVLIYNRAQVLAGLGRLEEALAGFSAVIDLDPNYPEYYFDRGNLLRRMGDDGRALADYEHAMTLTPPFLELYYNRADVRASAGDAEGAISDFGYVLELDPAHILARINRASLLLEAGDLARAADDVERGLEIDPANARLICTTGLIAMEEGDLDAARASFTRSLELDPGMHEALSNRAVAAHASGDYDAAIDDLTRALELVGDDPDLLYNRGHVYQTAQRWELAARDYARAMELPGADPQELSALRELCLASSAGSGGSREARAHSVRG
jgi:tetratricopeptide (TPR) repeat protein